MHHFGIPTLDGSDDAELLFLLGPAMRQRAGERGDREFGGGGAVGDGFDYARRHEGKWNEPPDVAFDLFSLPAIASNEFTRPSVRSFIQERARAMAISNASLAAGSRFV